MNALSKVVQAFRLLPIKEEQAEKALPEAAREGDLATLTRLVEEGVNLEASNYSGITALIAKQFSDTKVLQLLENSVLLTYRRVRRRSAGERETMHKTAARRVASVCVGEACVGVWVCPGCAPGPPKEISAF